MALIRGYKTRKILKNNQEILEYIQEIKELSKDTDDFETQIKLKTKKHIFIHTLSSLFRQKRSKKERKGPSSVGENHLLQKYLENQKNATVKISFKQLFDS